MGMSKIFASECPVNWLTAARIQPACATTTVRRSPAGAMMCWASHAAARRATSPSVSPCGVEASVQRSIHECVLVAAHGHLNRLLLLHAHGADPGTFWDVAQPNGWACRIDYRAHDANAIATSITPITVGYTGTDESHTIQKAD